MILIQGVMIPPTRAIDDSDDDVSARVAKFKATHPAFRIDAERAKNSDLTKAREIAIDQIKASHPCMTNEEAYHGAKQHHLELFKVKAATPGATARYQFGTVYGSLEIQATTAERFGR